MCPGRAPPGPVSAQLRAAMSALSVVVLVAATLLAGAAARSSVSPHSPLREDYTPQLHDHSHKHKYKHQHAHQHR